MVINIFCFFFLTLFGKEDIREHIWVRKFYPQSFTFLYKVGGNSLIQFYIEW